MQTVWVFGDAAAILNRVHRPGVSGYLVYGGRVYGNDTYSPLVNHYFPS
jgi:L-ascorbate oxidase